LMCHAIIGLKYVPQWIPVLALNISAPMGILSKTVQLYAIISEGDAGQVSAISWFLNFISSLSRLATFFISIPDKTLVISLTCSTVLNLAVAIAAFVFKSADIKKKKTK